MTHYEVAERGTGSVKALRLAYIALALVVAGCLLAHALVGVFMVPIGWALAVWAIVAAVRSEDTAPLRRTIVVSALALVWPVIFFSLGLWLVKTFFVDDAAATLAAV